MSIVWEKTMNKPAKRKKITNSDEMQDALVEDYFRYEELAEIEAEAIRHNMTGVKKITIFTMKKSMQCSMNSIRSPRVMKTIPTKFLTILRQRTIQGEKQNPIFF
jgi:hypothetical protein